MSAVAATAIIGATATLLSAAAAGWATIKQRRTEDVRLGYDALKTVMETYRSDSEDLRARLLKAEERQTMSEQRVTDLTAQVNKCEADKALQVIRFERERDQLLERIEHLEGVVGDA